MGNLFIKFVRIVNKAAEIVVMNVLFLFCCLPIVTMGQAWCALFSAIRYRLRGDRWWDGFWAGFKQNFWRGVIVWTIFAFIVVYMGLQSFIFVQFSLWAPLVISGIITLFFSMCLGAMIPLHVYLPTTFGKWLKNTFFVFRHAPHAPLITAILMWLPFALFLVNYALWYQMLIIFVAVYFAFVALVSTFLMRNSLIELHEAEEETK